MKYEVTKKQRGSQGQWFAYPAKRFSTAEAALTYAEAFAAEQAKVAGTRIVVTERKGSKFLAEFSEGMKSPLSKI